MAVTPNFSDEVANATTALRKGGIVAYPTEYCFGLGCDPRDQSAISKLLRIKQRKKEQGLILIAGNIEQVALYADLSQVPDLNLIKQSWPGPNTWLLPAHTHVSDYVRGTHSSIGIRIPDHPFCLALLAEFGHPIVSTSANRHGHKEHVDAHSTELDMGVECDYIVQAEVGGASKASTIRDAISGSTLR